MSIYDRLAAMEKLNNDLIDLKNNGKGGASCELQRNCKHEVLIYCGNDASGIHQQESTKDIFYCLQCGIKRFSVKLDEKGSSFILDMNGLRYSNPEDKIIRILKIYEIFAEKFDDEQIEPIVSCMERHTGISCYKATVTECSC